MDKIHTYDICHETATFSPLKSGCLLLDNQSELHQSMVFNLVRVLDRIDTFDVGHETATFSPLHSGCLLLYNQSELHQSRVIFNLVSWTELILLMYVMKVPPLALSVVGVSQSELHQSIILASWTEFMLMI